MIRAVLLAVTLVSGVPEQESNYDVICLNMRKGESAFTYDCTMSDKGFVHIDPYTCKNFGIKHAAVMNAVKAPSQIRGTCKEFRDGSIELELTIQDDPTMPVIEQEASANILPNPKMKEQAITIQSETI